MYTSNRLRNGGVRLKGILQLVVEVDYDEMIKEESLDALQLFTGVKGKEDIMRHHMANLGQKLNDVLKELPLVTYNINGDFIEGTEKNILPIVEEVIEEESEVVNVERNLELLEDALQSVSITFGIPQSIIVNDEMHQTMKLHNNGEDNFNTYTGFPVRHEAMEELFIIEYKNYVDNEISTYSSIMQRDGKLI